MDLRDIPLDLEEYDHDLNQRAYLFLALLHASPDQVEYYLSRIEDADEVFIRNTVEIDKPCVTYPDEISIIDRDVHWWLFRMPKMGLR